MNILIAEDDPVARRLLTATLERWGYSVTPTGNGADAWTRLQAPDPPPIAVLDWLMPEMDGVEVCRRARARPELRGLYLLLLTSRGDKTDLVQGLEAGADDYVIKPFNPDELRARVNVGTRVAKLQWELAERVKNLEEALAQVKQLRGLLPICAYCKKIRDDRNYWHQVESYMARETKLRFSHSVCPECMPHYLKDMDLE